jgi:hypothetical protein
MSKKDIDYSNTIIYKITCKDENVTDVYVGHTINFVQRKRAHKQSCINNKSCNYNCKLYDVIRNNGGWNNWKMDIIHFFNCKDHFEARQKEQEYFISLNATLNSVEPMPKHIKVTENTIKNPDVCEKCNIDCDTVQLLETHNNTKNYKKLMDSNDPSPKKLFKYSCELCDYKTINKNDFNKHNNTIKHLSNLKSSNHNFHCQICNKVYKDNSGLWRHKKKCIAVTNDDSQGQTIEKKDELINILLKENQDFKKLILEFIEKVSIEK